MLKQTNIKAPHYSFLWEGIHRSPMDYPHKGTVMRKAFPCHGYFMNFKLYALILKGGFLTQWCIHTSSIVKQLCFLTSNFLFITGGSAALVSIAGQQLIMMDCLPLNIAIKLLWLGAKGFHWCSFYFWCLISICIHVGGGQWARVVMNSTNFTKLCIFTRYLEWFHQGFPP